MTPIDSHIDSQLITRHQYLCRMTATNFLEVEIILLLLLRAHIGDLSMGRLVPETKKVINGVSLIL